MASQATIAKSYEITIVQVSGRLRLRLAQSVKAHVQVDAGGVTWRTRDAIWKKGGEIPWNEKNILLPLAPSEKITFSLIRDGRILNKSSNVSQGLLEIDLAELLRLSNRQPNEGRF
ncbi:hypothetical protein FIBSPDRAFT_969372 [Athelia psychrophila]|uniref:C2 domain-containing protein n=1 Tax=Athelia psychrophila TaxID=1759441 RepID=A0A167TKY9_9AGAM|nr:hypothetical protein FIBSPDRAFT_969372 [Fibularhizoctonia sp. CBS 109695]